MPVYNCTAPAGSISMQTRKKIATAITDVHCKSTNAPRSFVHVFFRETTNGGSETSGVDTPFFIDGVNRAGREANVVLELKSELRKAYSDIAGVPVDQVGARISEVPASWVMEAGAILPEPGEEGEEWYSSATAQ